VKKVLIPEENVKDLQEIPENAKNQLEIVPVRWIDKVLEFALEAVPKALPDEDAVPKPVVEDTVAAGAATDVVRPSGDTLPH
jgi:ATP-dependent Lon protease